MKKIYLIAAAAMFAACTSDDLMVEQPAQQVTDNAVVFDVYTQRANTRAGWAGSLDTDRLKKAAGYEDGKGGGFGVFAYYTDNNNYDQQAKPNFMYNECVTWPTNSKWEYSPVKYWPNEYGSTAISDDADKVSFFAYAPYVEVDEVTGKPTKDYTDANPFGIQQLNRNTAAGDPIVKYQGTFATNKGVDLCWGVCNQTSWVNVQTGTNQGLAFGKPWIDVQRPADPTANQKLQFTFKHATAKLNVQIDHFTDGYTASEALKPETRIYVRSIKFTGFAMKGALNLNNTEAGANKPYWLDYTCNNELNSGEEVTIYDGRKDGKEGVNGAIATNEKVLGLNVPLIQTQDAFNNGDWKNDEPYGVTNSAQNLFAKWNVATSTWEKETAKDAPIYVIPTDDAVTVEIVYDVETIDPNLNGYLSDGKTNGSTIQNRIRKEIYFGSANTFEAGKAYEIKLHLGMNSVKFDAEVVDWDVLVPATDIDLPANMPQFSANANADIPGSATTYTFAITGLTGGETVDITTNELGAASTNYTVGSTPGSADKHANPSGVAYVTITPITPNTDVVNGTPKAVTLTRSNSSTVTVTVTQLAQKLGLAAHSNKWIIQNSGDPDYCIFTTTAEIDGASMLKNSDGTAASWDGTKWEGDGHIYVWHNGAQLENSDTPAAGKFKVTYNSTDPKGYKIEFAEGTVNVNDQIKVTVKTGNVPEETAFYTVTAIKTTY